MASSDYSLANDISESFIPSSNGLSDFNEAIARNKQLRAMAQGGQGKDLAYGDARV